MCTQQMLSNETKKIKFQTNVPKENNKQKKSVYYFPRPWTIENIFQVKKKNKTCKKIIYQLPNEWIKHCKTIYNHTL